MDWNRCYADRIGGSNFGSSQATYKFKRIRDLEKKAKINHPNMRLLDFGLGEPDQLPSESARKVLKTAIDTLEYRGYAGNGIAEFKRAASSYMDRTFGVPDIDPESEINHCIGVKSALAILPTCFVNSGDLAFTTVPGYPVLPTWVGYLGGQVKELMLQKANGFIPDLSAISPKDANRAKLIYVNYPNNPTGRAADETFFTDLIRFAEKYNLLIVHDAAYATLVYQSTPLSILAIPGAKETCIELHSLSKSHHMTGWRLGFLAGNKHAIRAFAHVKDNFDSGQFKAIQIAAAAEISTGNTTNEARLHYERRLKILIAALGCVGFQAEMPGGTCYLYVDAPKRIDGKLLSNAQEAAEHLVEHHLISTTPWDDAGPYLRFSVTYEANGEDDEKSMMQELIERLSGANPEW